MRTIERGNDAQPCMQYGTRAKWAFRAKNAEARKLDVIRKVKFALHGAWTCHAAFTQVDHTAGDRIVVQAFFRITEHIIGTIDALHLHSPIRSRQVRMEAPRQLSISSLYRVSICIYWYAKNSIVVIGCIHKLNGITRTQCVSVL